MATEKLLQQSTRAVIGAVDLNSILPIVDVLAQFIGFALASMSQPPPSTAVHATPGPQPARSPVVRTKVQPNGSPPPLIGDERYTVAQVAMIVKRTKMTVHKWIREGEVKSTKDDRGRHLIEGKELTRKMTKDAMNGAAHTQQ